MSEATESTVIIAEDEAMPPDDRFTEEPDCERVTGEENQEAEFEEDARTVELEDELEASGAADFLRPGGGWGGSETPVLRAIAIARRNGLTITSRKRSWGSTRSDHHTSQRHSYAADMSDGSSPTPGMDQTARQIAAALGRPGWRAGILNVRASGMRAQLIWRWTGHFNHVHFGVRRGG